jgi:glycosyl transferase family 1/glycosyl transferase family 4
VFILHIDSGVEMRGGQWQALYLMRGLAAAGHQVRLLTPAGSPLMERAQADGIDARSLGIAALAGATSDVRLIHAHDARAHTLALLGGKPVVVSRRVAFPVRRGVGSRWKYGRAAHYIAVSQCVKQTLTDAGIGPERIAVVYDGVPIGTAPPKWGSRSGVLALDSDDPAKGKKIVEQAGAIANVAAHFSKNLTEDLLRAAVFVYITELEGLGSAALLAMAAGAPVLASRVGGLPEIVEDGVTGLLTSNDPRAVAKGIERLLGDQELAARLSAAARSRVEKHFTIQRMLNETVQVYERMLN